MTRQARLLFLVVVLVLAGAAALSFPWGPIRAPDAPQPPDGPDGAPPTSANGTDSPRADSPRAGTPRAAPSDDGRAPADPGMRSSPDGLRVPNAPDGLALARLRALLDGKLANADPRWDEVADLVASAGVPLDPAVSRGLLDALVDGRAAGALRAFDRVRDAALVPELFSRLDDPSTSPEAKDALLLALSRMPIADLGPVATGLAGRLKGDLEHDRPFLQALVRRGGVDAVRALADAIASSRDPDAWADVTEGALDLLRSDPEAGAAVADSLSRLARTASARPAEIHALLRLAGRPGAPAELVDAIVEHLAAGSTPEVRAQALRSLAATGDERAVAKLAEIASDPNAEMSPAAGFAIGSITSATPGARARLLELATTTKEESLRLRVVGALGGLAEPKAVPVLTDWVRSGSDELRKHSAAALGRLGAAANPAVPALGDAYAAGDETLQNHVALTLGQIATPEAVSLLRQLAAAPGSPRAKETIRLVLARMESGKRPP
jgi:HEAT repeat protein